MKKLMVAAAAAAMTGAVFAEAQVYDAKLTVKTTTCKTGKWTQALEDAYAQGLNAGEKIMFRKQASRKINGVIWGCDCETIADPQWRVYAGGNLLNPQDTVGGYAFWDATAKTYVPYTIPYVNFQWLVLNRIDAMKKVEGTWVLQDAAAGEAFFFVGAGFGSAKSINPNCASIISSISGNFAGWMQYYALNVEGDDCVFCGGNVTLTGCFCAPFCDTCSNAADTTLLTAAYGTWSIKYNSSASKQLLKKSYITGISTYKGKKFANVDLALDAAEKAVIAVAPKAEDEWEEGLIILTSEFKDGYFEELIGTEPEQKDDESDEDFEKRHEKWEKAMEVADPGLVTDDPDFPENAAKYIHVED